MSAALREAIMQAAKLIADALNEENAEGLPVPPTSTTKLNRARKVKRPPPPTLAPRRELSEHTRAMARRELQRLGYHVGAKR